MRNRCHRYFRVKNVAPVHPNVVPLGISYRGCSDIGYLTCVMLGAAYRVCLLAPPLSRAPVVVGRECWDYKTTQVVVAGENVGVDYKV